MVLSRRSPKRERDIRLLMLLVGVTALLMLVGPPSVSRAVADDAGACNHAIGDEAIAACTRAINSGRWRGPDLAIAYKNRGHAYQAKGDNDRAIADYAEAIRLDPEDAFAYNGRGNAYQVKRDKDGAKHVDRAKGDNDRAIADYSEAIRLDPKYALLHQPGKRVSSEGRQRPRHRRLRRGDPARSQIRLRLQRPGQRAPRRGRQPPRQGRQRPRQGQRRRHRRLRRGDPARSRKRLRLHQPGKRISRRRRQRPRHRRLRRGDPAPSRIRVSVQRPGKCALRPGRLSPRHRRLHGGDCGSKPSPWAPIPCFRY